MKRDDAGIYEVQNTDTSILDKIFHSPNIISEITKSVTTALLNTMDFSRNAMLKGVLVNAQHNSQAIQDKILGSESKKAEFTARLLPYLTRIEFLKNLKDTTGDKTLDAVMVWEKVDASSDNFSDWILDQIYNEVGLSQVSKLVNYTFFDIYDLLAYKYA